MSFLDEVGESIRAVIGNDDRPLVVYAAAWPFLRELRRQDPAAVDELLEVLLEAAGHRTVLMPTFARGYVDGVCNLDDEPSLTGVLTERFRTRPGVRRTLSAFFPFSVLGDATGEVIELQPGHAWGEGSLYEWMERRDVCFLKLGTHPTHSSYLHRLEWLARDVVRYRFDKTFTGTIVRDGVSRPITETLFVRQLDPPVINDFTGLVPILQAAGMQEQSPRGVSIVSYRPQPVIERVLPLLRQDPYLVLKNREAHQAHGD